MLSSSQLENHDRLAEALLLPANGCHAYAFQRWEMVSMTGAMHADRLQVVYVLKRPAPPPSGPPQQLPAMPGDLLTRLAESMRDD